MSGLTINIDETKSVKMYGKDKRLNWEGHFGLDWSYAFTALGFSGFILRYDLNIIYKVTDDYLKFSLEFI